MSYQYQVFNNNVSTVVTISLEDEEYAINFAKKCLMRYYNKKLEELENLKCKFICEFFDESFINVDFLESK